MNIEKMRDKAGPWMPALFCAVLAVIVTIGNLWAAMSAGSNSAATGTFILFMPMCFFFVGTYLTKLKKENAELRERLDAIDPLTEKATAGSVDRQRHESGEQDAAEQPATSA